MTDQSVAAIARNLGKALMARAKSRTDVDQKLVLALQTELCAELHEEEIKTSSSDTKSD